MEASRKVALVLAGGAARGAYEVGVVAHILEEVSRDLGRDVPLDILCGTSVGAINACMLAAFADEPRARAQRLVDRWAGLHINDLVRVDVMRVLGLLRNMVRPPRPEPIDAEHQRRGGLVDPSGIERLIRDAIPFERIGTHIISGRLTAVTISTTHVGSGRTVVFVARGERGLPPWSSDATVIARAAELRAEHALASAAIPVLFPAVAIDGHFYCDGGLRQNVPLSPARRLGADGLIVVNPRYLKPPTPFEQVQAEQAFPSPWFLIGKTLNALLLDRLESDIDRLERINALLLAGVRRYGDRFLDEINDEMGRHGKAALRPMRAVLIRASTDIGKMSAEFVRSPAFRRRAPGMVGRLMAQLADGEPTSEADLLSYLLFDGEFARQLIALGRSDARARHAELCAFFEALT